MTIKDGWHTVGGQRVYVEDGYIIRGVGVSLSGWGYVTTYPYWYDNKQRCWNRVKKVKVKTFYGGRYMMK